MHNAFFRKHLLLCAAYGLFKIQQDSCGIYAVIGEAFDMLLSVIRNANKKAKTRTWKKVM